MSEASVSENQQEMGERLVLEAVGESGVEFLPMDDRVMIYPVVPDERRPVDIYTVQLGSAELPELGVVVSVGWKVNAEVIERIRQIEGKKTPSELDFHMKQVLEEVEFVGKGDIVAVNKFSGMDIPGTNFIVLSRQDVLGKLRGFPVRLRRDQDRWDQLEQRRAEHAGEVAADAIVTPVPEIVRATK